MRAKFKITGTIAGLILLLTAGWSVLASEVSGGHTPASGVAPQQALAQLLEGNQRFTKGQSATPDLSAARLHELTAGQKPYAVVLTCADSRVAPEHLFNAGLGDLFVIRVAGNIADSDVIASTEYAVAHLGTRLVVVLGHDSCGAVKAAVAGAKDTPAIEGLVAQIAPAVTIARDEGLKDEALLDRAIVVNANKAREKLINQSALLKDLLVKGELKVISGKYELGTGQVKWLNLDGLSATDSAAHPAHVEAPAAVEHGAAHAGAEHGSAHAAAQTPATQPQAAVLETHAEEH
jgi:carbonic anhydrase